MHIGASKELEWKEEEFNQIAELCSYLEVFQQLTDYLQGTKYPTISYVWPSFAALRNVCLSKVNSKSESVKNLNELVLNKLELVPLSGRHLPQRAIVISTLLHPAHRQLGFAEPAVREQALLLLREAYAGIEGRTKRAQPSLNIPRPASSDDALHTLLFGVR